MDYSLSLYSVIADEIFNFLNSFYENSDNISDWEITSYPSSDNEGNNIYIYTKRTTNPLDFVVLIGALIDNNSKFNINALLSLDKGTFINITHNNLDSIIKYLYERFPY